MKKFISKLYSPQSLAQEGFSLLELVTVVAVIGILSATALPKIGDFIKESKIDSAKSKLNTAAVKCLQDIRSGANPSDPIDSNTISDKLLESDEYKIIDGLNTCSVLKIKPIDEKDRILFEMGFSIDNNGRLTKFATPVSSDERSCKSWAGENCKPDKELMELIAHNNAVQEAKIACNDPFYAWLNGTPPGDGKKIKWDDKNDSACIKYPDGNPPARDGCRINGCTLETWAFEGTIVNGENGYKQALESKYGKICTEKLEEKEQSKYTGGPVSILECGSSKVMWFHNGDDVGSEEKMNELICADEQSKHQAEGTTGQTKITSCGDTPFYYCLGEDKKTEALMKQCESESAGAVCEQEIKKAKDNNYEGGFVPDEDKSGSVICTTKIWLCKGLQYPTEAAYSDSECGLKSKPPEENKCGKPKTQKCYDKNFRSTKNGKKACKKWAKCMGL